MSKKKEIKKVLLKDIIIPAGTIFRQASAVTTRNDDFVSCIIGLSNNTFGELTYDISDDKEIIDTYFTDLKE
jgi:hypothetical protein